MLDQTRGVVTVAGTHEYRRLGRRDGVSSGNSKAISLTLASKGTHLVLAARRVQLLEAVAREVKVRDLSSTEQLWSLRGIWLQKSTRLSFTRHQRKTSHAGEGKLSGFCGKVLARRRLRGTSSKAQWITDETQP
jgi:hypothetical protein